MHFIDQITKQCKTYTDAIQIFDTSGIAMKQTSIPLCNGLKQKVQRYASAINHKLDPLKELYFVKKQRDFSDLHWSVFLAYLTISTVISEHSTFT